MKVLYLITKGNWGGAQRYVYDLALAAKASGDEVVVAHGEGRALPDKLQAAGIKTTFIPALGRDINPLLDTTVFFSFYKLFQQEQPDVVHLNSPKASGLGALAGRLVGIKKIIYTAHGWAFNETRPVWQKVVIRFLSWLTIVLCHQVIVIAQSELDQAPALTQRGAKKIKLIYNGLAPPVFLNRAEARASLDPEVKEGDIWLGTIAELHPNKGLSYGLIAMVKLKTSQPNRRWLIIGEGEKRAELEKLIGELGLTDQVKLIGARIEAAKYLPAFDIYFCPSVKEGLPYVLLEAGAAGLPVVATTVGGIPEIISDGHSGLLVSPAQPQALAQALQQLLANPTLRTQYGQNLKHKVETDFGLDRMLAETRQLYRSA